MAQTFSKKYDLRPAEGIIVTETGSTTSNLQDGSQSIDVPQETIVMNGAKDIDLKTFYQFIKRLG